MRTTLFVGAIAFATTVGAFAADQSWTGQISDSKCGISHMAAKHGKKMSDRECAQLCVKSGAQYVLVAEGKVYKLTNHDADLSTHAGRTVTVGGNLAGDTIRVSTIAMAR
jgi:hypothetical protein